MNWQELASTSPYRTAVAVEEALQQGMVQEAATGIQELIEALSRSDKRALKSHLTRLMAHVIKWQTQPEKRSRGWRATIRSARRDIVGIQEDTPSLTRTVIEGMWQNCLEAAQEDAEGDMNQQAATPSLTWEEVFEKDYDIE